MPHHFKPGDRALFVYEDELMEGIVQDAYEEEVIIQFPGVSRPSSLESFQLEYIQPLMIEN